MSGWESGGNRGLLEEMGERFMIRLGLFLELVNTDTLIENKPYFDRK